MVSSHLFISLVLKGIFEIICIIYVFIVSRVSSGRVMGVVGCFV